MGHNVHVGRVLLFGAVAGLLLAAACDRTFKGSATQPNPLNQPLETLRTSEEILIITGDKDLTYPGVQRHPGGDVQVDKRYPLHNKARFTVISRDRLRFHVQIEHKWKEWADVRTWKAELFDDRGRHYLPEEVDLIADKHVVFMWDYERRSAIRNRHGDIMYVNNDGWKRRNPLASMSLFRGLADISFYSRNIFTPDIKTLTLRLDRGSMTYQFTWQFDDDRGNPPVAKQSPSAGPGRAVQRLPKSQAK